MRLTRAGIALIIFLLIVCPLGAGLSYAALTGQPIGPIALGGRATNTPVLGVTPVPAVPTSGGGATVFTPTPRAGSPAASASPTVAGALPSGATAPAGPTATGVGARPSAPVAGTTPPGVATTATAAPPAASPTVAAGPQMVVAYDSYAPYFPVRIAEVQGYYKSRNLTVRQVPFGLNGNEFSEEGRRAALRDGTFDVLLTTLDAVALFGDDRTGKVVAIVDESAGADKIVARAPIARLNDLRGKRIAFSAGSVAEFYLYASLNLAGLKASDVQLRPVESVDAAVDLFVQNGVDAVVGWEPVIQEAIGAGGKVLLGSDNYRAILDVMVVSNKALAEKPAAVQAFMDAWFEAVKLTTDDPGRAGTAVVQSGNTEWTGVENPEDYADALKLVAQATLGQNAFALRDPALLGNRLREIQGVWRAGGKQVVEVDTTRLIDGNFVQKTAERSELNSTRSPVNASFVLTGRIALPRLTPEQLGNTQAVAELPLKEIAFEPNSAVLSPQGQKDLAEQIVPVLRQTPGLYLRVDGSAAQPLGDTPQENEAFARQRAQAVIFFLIGQGIDGNRLIEGYQRPQFPGSTDENQLRQDRRVIFTLVQPGGR
jgi:NitT/TauT family transport system substrate-binding protein